MGLMDCTTNKLDREMPPKRSPSKLNIWQQNVNRSCTCQHDLISSVALARQGIDIVALQEPAINNSRATIATRDWVSVYPTTHGKEPSRKCFLILIRSNIITDQWKQIDFPSGNVTTIAIHSNWGELLLYNIYNNCTTNDTVIQLETFNRTRPSPNRSNINGSNSNTQPTIWLGDFNRHHPHWDNPNDTRLFTKAAIQDTEVLINAIGEIGLNMVLPLGILTHLHNVSKKWTRLDHIFITEDHMSTIMICEALADTPGVNTDHLPILTSLDLDLARAPSNPPKNFQNVDWEEFENDLTDRLNKLPAPTAIKTTGELDKACSKLTTAVQETINVKVPMFNPGIKAKQWWTKELQKLRQEANKKGRAASKYKDWPENHTHVERHKANKIFQRLLEHTKRQHWRDWLEKADDPDIWTTHRYMSTPAGDGGKSRIPVSKLTKEGQENTATTSKEKSRMLASTFFPPSPPENTALHFVYPKPVAKFNHIPRDQIKQQLARLKPYKAPGPDSIPNIILTRCANILTDPWRLSTTVVLGKPGKPHYDTPKVYRLIALLNTMSKVLTVLMAELMTYFTETHQLLLAHHFGGRPGRATSDVVHLLVHRIKDAWRKQQVTAVLFLDIEGAFPNAVTNRLLHSMKKRWLPEKLITFAGLML